MQTRFDLAEQVFYASLAVTVGLLGVLALGQGQWGLALAALALGAGWGGAHWRVWRGVAPLAFAALVGVAAGGLWGHLPATGLVVCVAAALGAWDLDGLASRLAQFNPRPEYARLVRNHVGRLLVVLGAGVALGEAALWFRFTLGFGLVLGLGFLAFLILTQAARLLMGEAAPEGRGRAAKTPPPAE